MEEHEINSQNNFIMGWYQEDFSVLDKLLDFFNRSKKTPGYIYGADGLQIDKTMKDSMDTYLEPGTELFHEYAGKYLQPCTEKYKEKYPMCNMQSPWSITNNINIQYYPPGGGFHKWHTERFGGQLPVAACHLVFMTYLNDVFVGGDTEFLHQGVKIKPRKGLTLIWPADWTFTHRGISAPDEEKYIITGWYHYTE